MSEKNNERKTISPWLMFGGGIALLFVPSPDPITKTLGASLVLGSAGVGLFQLAGGGR